MGANIRNAAGEGSRGGGALHIQNADGAGGIGGSQLRWPAVGALLLPEGIADDGF